MPRSLILNGHTQNPANRTRPDCETKNNVMLRDEKCAGSQSGGNQRRTFDNQIPLGDWFATDQYTMGLMPNDHLCGDVANLRQKTTSRADRKRDGRKRGNNVSWSVGRKKMPHLGYKQESTPERNCRKPEPLRGGRNIHDCQCLHQNDTNFPTNTTHDNVRAS